MVLRLLLVRELVGKDDLSGQLYRILAGPSAPEVEQRLSALHTRVHRLPGVLVVEREKEPLVCRVQDLRERFSPALDEETLEELSIQANQVEGELAAIVNRKRQNLQDELTKQVQETQRRIGIVSRTTELDEDVPAGLDFRRHLVDLQEILRKERKSLSGELNRIHQQLKELHDETNAVLDAEALPNFYDRYTRAISNLTGLHERADRFDRQRKGLVDWFKLLKVSELDYKSLAAMSDLRTRMTDEVVREIMHNFTKKGVKALDEDVEHFQLRFAEIERERDVRIAAGNDAFGEVKQSYRQWLASTGVERPDFPARYSPLEHEQSYQDMYEQVKKLAIGYLDHLMEQTESLDLDLRQARRIYIQKLSEEERKTLADLEKRRATVQAGLQAAHKWLSTADLTLTDDLDEWREKIKSISQLINGVDEGVRQLRKVIPPQTPEEQQVLALLAGRREADLTELVLAAGDELDLDGMMTGIKGLYQGNQVSVKLQKRG
jgi:hypothetical protein